MIIDTIICEIITIICDLGVDIVELQGKTLYYILGVVTT
jgi:hypothetical protein